MKESQAEQMKERVDELNNALQDARGRKPVPSRIGLIWNKLNDVLVVDVTGIETYHMDMKTVTIKGNVVGIIQNPTHLDFHNVISAFKENKLEDIIEDI